LLAHPLVKIRRFTYEECLNIVRRAINVKAAAENPGHTQSNTCRFLLDSEVLHEICSHGLSDTSRLVSYPAQELISVLVQSRLLVADEIWLQLHAALAPVLPILQGYSGESEILKSALSSYMTATEHPDISSDIDLLKASLRGFDVETPNFSLQQLLNKDGTMTRISGLIDLLMVDTPLSLVPRDEADCFRIRRCIFQEEAVIRMLSVFRSLTAEASVRIGALRQLATMLDDANLHRVFLKHKGLDSVCEKLKSISADDVTILTDDVKPVVSACITIMKVIMRSDAVSRERLSHDRDLLLRLLHLANLTRLSVAAMSDVCVVIALLVFHDVLRDHVRPESGNTKCEFTELSLPAAVVARYQIPFLCPSHHAVSIHRTLVTPPSPSCDQLISGPAATALRIAWNVAEFGNHVPTTCTDAVISSEANQNNGLRLSESDHLNLVFSHPDTASAALIDAIIGSQSHAAAIHVFSLMRIMTMTFHGSINFITAIFMDSSEKWKTTFGKFLQSFLRFHRELRTVILVRLRLADAPQFYDLPSMEVTLQCLVHISANQVTIDIQRNQIVDISATDKVLLQQLLGTLLEIVSAFHIGSGASSLSYMGKGVSRCATQCILQLAREMAVYKINVRFFWLAIASAVSQTKKGCVTLAKGFQRCPGGLWSMTLCVLLDHSECSAVRGQASDLLCNMIAWKLAASPSDVASGELWQVI
uniref:Rotatin N-terminal domain-containing protein n=1 Tax=Ciona savignyi TaxID=51511 RepID=H2YGD6_CIOSA